MLNDASLHPETSPTPKGPGRVSGVDYPLKVVLRELELVSSLLQQIIFAEKVNFAVNK